MASTKSITALLSGFVLYVTKGEAAVSSDSAVEPLSLYTS